MAVQAVTMHMMSAGPNFPTCPISLKGIEKARQALGNYFMFSTADGIDMPDSIILTILLARKESNAQNFEQLMLEIGAYCDERLDSATNAGRVGRRNFLRLIGMLQRLEEASKRINKLVLFAHGIPGIDTLKMLSATWIELNAIKQGLFRELLVEDLHASDLLGRMGHKRLTNLLDGLDCISRGTGTLQDIQLRMEQVERDEKILVKVVTTIQDAIGTNYGWVAGDGERDTIKRIVSIELRHQRLMNGDEIPDKLFDVGLRLAKSSLMYMNTLLPIIVAQGDTRLREEFIRDSGLDRLLVEELEEFWCARENVPGNRLDSIRSAL
jgi:uncharacterized protein (TIGR04442 family)